VILRALLGSEVEPDVSIREARVGDRYLLCSDGLSDVVSSETILDTMRIEDTQECADRLVELALRGGGPDNVTVIVADVLNARVGDTIDDVPVLGGAFVDPAAADVPGSDSAAGRAALMARPKPAEATPAPPHRRIRSWRPWLVVVGVLVLLVAGLGGTYAWAQTQYFVGRAGAEVVIYRGVNTEFGPLKFFNFYRGTGLRVDDLNPSVRTQVSDGINASSKVDAEHIVAALRAQKMPPCPRPPSTTPSSPSVPVPTATGSRPATHAPTSAASKRSSVRATGSQASGAAARVAGPSNSSSTSSAPSTAAGASSTDNPACIKSS
jgi:protein phosphatase